MNTTKSDPLVDLLPSGTSAIWEKTQGRKIHCKNFDDSHECREALESYETKVVLLGNSMLHAVNQADSDTKLTPLRLHESFQGKI